MSLRPLKISNDLANDGAIKEFLLSDEDYLAYRAGTYLSSIIKTESSALTDAQTATTADVGTYEDTIYNPEEPSDEPTVHTRTYTARAYSDPSSSTNTIEFENPVALPALIY